MGNHVSRMFFEIPQCAMEQKGSVQARAKKNNKQTNKYGFHFSCVFIFFQCLTLHLLVHATVRVYVSK